MISKIRQFFRYHKWVTDDSNNEILNPGVFAVICEVCENKGKFLAIFGAGCEKNRGCKGRK